MPTYFKLFIFVGVVVVLLGIAFSLQGEGDSGEPIEDDTAPATQPVTFKQFYDLNDGMSYDDVVKALGREGQAVDTDDEQNDEGEPIAVITYRWFNDDGSNMTATFKNDSLARKHQYDLK